VGLRILIAEPDGAFRQAMQQALSGHELVQAGSAEAVVTAQRENPFPLVVIDAALGAVGAGRLIGQVQAADPGSSVVVTADDPCGPEALVALRAGAYDCLERAGGGIRMAAALRRAVERVTLFRDNQNLLNSLKRNVEAFGCQNRRLEQMATRDGLTGLFNQRYFLEALDLELSRSRRHGHKLSLIFADVDFFKMYNDTHGHQAGDALLVTLAELIAKASRRSTVVARYGGEEFVLLVPEIDRDGVMAYAEKLRAFVAEHPFPGAEALPGGRISMSFGVSTFPDDGDDSAALIKCADDALYRAKGSGRNAVCA
jgi:diguanylate cyclase (GGDEF)-like protein